MVEIQGQQRPSSYEEAVALAEPIEARIEAARNKVLQAKDELLRVCVEAYPVGTRVQVNVAARRDPLHEVVSVNEHGWLTLRNCYTGTERGMLADSYLIKPPRVWYEKVEKK